MIFPVEIRIFCPKTTKFGPKLAFLVNLGQAMQALLCSVQCPVGGSVGGCGALAVSRKTPIYLIFMRQISKKMEINSHFKVGGCGGGNVQMIMMKNKCEHRILLSSLTPPSP